MLPRVHTVHRSDDRAGDRGRLVVLQHMEISALDRPRRIEKKN